ncbi:hypothetical protein B0A55_06819 [Friedmanniomyces simplex]|uniref:Uncharacterized protein n=1 Tax=Friedmanniomyces simplex TaxID=329884 RepID=A0A4U0X8Z9_9PEZI|nr:hypothetical protein B0A55_06819 [Friedmanniomyces simplex]
MLHANLKKGTIVWRWDDRTNKGRYWLIVHSTSKKVWDIAIYTNGDTGLRNLGPGRRRHYFSLRPMGVDAADFKNQSSTHDYVSIDCMNRDDRQIVGKPMRSTMIARFTEVFEHDINKEGLRVVGAIAEKDVVFAVGKAWDYIKK